eukprot:scaffold115235_cov70-Cyclotella_meneghiniana.AAC.7
MVFYFTTRCGNYTIYMGKDKYENEDLIKYGLPEDCCLSASKTGDDAGEWSSRSNKRIGFEVYHSYSAIRMIFQKIVCWIVRPWSRQIASRVARNHPSMLFIHDGKISRRFDTVIPA